MDRDSRRYYVDTMYGPGSADSVPARRRQAALPEFGKGLSKNNFPVLRRNVVRMQGTARGA